MSEYAISRGPRTPAYLAEHTDGLLFRRWAACWIDLLLAGLSYFVGVFVLGAIGGIIGGLSASRADGFAVLAALGALAVPLLYYAVLESTTGQTVGKMALGLQVVGNDGRVAPPARIALRTLLRLIEINPFLLGGLPAGVVALLNKRRQRLGDMAAGTYVVLKKDVQPIVKPEEQAIVFD